MVTGEVEVDEMTALPDKLAVEPEVPGTKEAIVAIEDAISIGITKPGQIRWVSNDYAVLPRP